MQEYYFQCIKCDVWEKGVATLLDLYINEVTVPRIDNFLYNLEDSKNLISEDWKRNTLIKFKKFGAYFKGKM